MRCIAYYLMDAPNQCVAWTSCPQDARVFLTEAEAQTVRQEQSGSTIDWELKTWATDEG